MGFTQFYQFWKSFIVGNVCQRVSLLNIINNILKFSIKMSLRTRIYRTLIFQFSSLISSHVRFNRTINESRQNSNYIFRLRFLISAFAYLFSEFQQISFYGYQDRNFVYTHRILLSRRFLSPRSAEARDGQCSWFWKPIFRRANRSSIGPALDTRFFTTLRYSCLAGVILSSWLGNRWQPMPGTRRILRWFRKARLTLNCTMDNSCVAADDRNSAISKRLKGKIALLSATRLPVRQIQFSAFLASWIITKPVVARWATFRAIHLYRRWLYFLMSGQCFDRNIFKNRSAIVNHF